MRHEADLTHRILFVACLVMLGLVGLDISVRFWPTETRVGEDIYYSWVEGGRILSGENPYARVNEGDMQVNRKYATYLPAFFLLSALTQEAGLKQYDEWINFWRAAFAAFYIGTGLALFAFFFRNGQLWVAVFAAVFWLANRWTLHVVQVAGLEVMPIFFFVVSLMLFRTRRRSSLLLLSLSLAIKQLAVFAAPLYLIVAWRMSDREKLRSVLKSAALIFSVPLLTSLPFLIWNASGFVRSMLFSVTRNPETQLGVDSVEVLLGLTGPMARLPMLGLLVIVYFVAARTEFSLSRCAFLAMATFLDFNPVLFRQYPIWLIPLVPLALFAPHHSAPPERSMEAAGEPPPVE